MSLIYEPRGRAREYAALACNLYRGCDHRCTYCYAPNATYSDRQEFGRPQLRKNIIANLRNDAKKLWQQATRDAVLLCFTCDPYQAFDVDHQITRQAIEILHARQIPVQILTKGGSRALRDVDLFTPADAFATTMTWLDSERSLEWEPGAATPDDRIYTLHRFHEVGVPTWVSLEPVLDPDVALQIIRETHTFVDLFKIGKLNYHPLAKTIAWRDFAIRVVNLLELLNHPYYLKDDLKKLLPASVATPSQLGVRDIEQQTAARFPSHDIDDEAAHTLLPRRQTQQMDLQPRLL